MNTLTPIQKKQIFEKKVKNPQYRNEQGRANCPYHVETTPNNKAFNYNIKIGVFNCVSCGTKGNIWQFSKNFNIDLRDYGLSINPIDKSFAEDCHQHLQEHPERRLECWNEFIVKELKVGWNKKVRRIVFPIFNTQGDIVNVKQHKGPQITGAHATLYPLNHINKYCKEYIVICEGEKDAVSLLSQGIPAITSTGGALTVPKNISLLNIFKSIYLCFDNDDTGRKGAEKWLIRLYQLNPSLNLRICDLTKVVDAKGDVTDYFSATGKNRESFLTEVLEKSYYAKRAFTDNPNYISEVKKSNCYIDLVPRDKVVLDAILTGACRYYVTTNEFKGMRFDLDPGQYIISRKRLAEKCGRDITVPMVRRAMESLEKSGFIKSEDLKGKRGMRITLIGWNEEYGQSKRQSADKKSLNKKYPFYLSNNDLSQLTVGSKQKKKNDQ